MQKKLAFSLIIAYTIVVIKNNKHNEVYLMEYIERTRKMSFADPTLNITKKNQSHNTSFFRKHKKTFEMGDSSFDCPKHESTKRNW